MCKLFDNLCKNNFGLADFLKIIMLQSQFNFIVRLYIMAMLNYIWFYFFYSPSARQLGLSIIILRSIKNAKIEKKLYNPNIV